MLMKSNMLGLYTVHSGTLKDKYACFFLRYKGCVLGFLILCRGLEYLTLYNELLESLESFTKCSTWVGHY